MITEKSDTAVIKLADFGLARHYETAEDLFETSCGTPIYMAPEIQRGQPYNEQADLWSVGIILFELIAGFPPFTGRNRAELKVNIAKGTYRFPPGVNVSKVCIHLISQLLISDPSKRIEWSKFFEHAFIKCNESLYK